MHFPAQLADLQIMVPAVWAWLSSAFESFAQDAGGTLVTSIWQGAAIVCVLEIAIRLVPRISAAHRFAIWSAGFGLAAVIPFLGLLHLGGNPTSQAVSNVGVTAGASPALFQFDARWALALAGFWAVASLIRAADLAIHSVRLRQLWKAAEPVQVSEHMLAEMNDLRGGRVAICTTTLLDRPSVIGFFAPRILIPDWLLARVTHGELEQIVLHEAEHLRRCDDWTNLLQKLCLVAFPLNPALAWIEHRLCREREMACDEGVVRITKAPRAYAACLASIAERGLERREEALSLGAWHRRSELVHRVHLILLRKPHLSRTTASVLVGTMGCALLAGSLEMARCPQLVSFVPRQNALAMTPTRQQQLSAMLARENAEAKIKLPESYRAVEAKAVLPPHHRAKPDLEATHESRAASVVAHAHAPSQPTAQMAKADQIGDRVITSDGRQWVILSAWEEVRTVSRAPQPIPDYTPGGDASAPTGENAEASLPGQAPSGTTSSAQPGTPAAQKLDAAHQFTVTQLILRVVPAESNASSKSTQSPQGLVRGGWFVIQL